MSGGRGSGISVLVAWHDDDDDDISFCKTTEEITTQKFEYKWTMNEISYSVKGLFSSSCHAISTDVSDPLTPALPSSWSSGLHPVSAQSCCTQVLAGRPAFARPWEGVHRSTALISSSLLLQQCPTCPVRLIAKIFVMGGRWPYSCCFVGFCLQDLFNIACNILA